MTLGKYKGDLALLLAALIWGTSFISQKLGMNYMEPLTFTAARFLLGGIVLIPIILFYEQKNKTADKSASTSMTNPGELPFQKKDLLIGGTLCGASIFLGASAQQIGIVYTTAGKAAFITALYIVVVPLLGLFLKHKVPKATWVGVVLAVVGLYLLTIHEGLSIQKGDAIVLLGTVFWAFQIITMDHYVNKTDGLKLSCLQFFIAGLLSAAAAFVFETPVLTNILAGGWLILYMGFFAVGLAYSLQIIGQKQTKPSVAAIIMSLESVFAVIFGALLLQESMTARELSGCVLMFAAFIVTQVKPKELGS